MFYPLEASREGRFSRYSYEGPGGPATEAQYYELGEI